MTYDPKRDEVYYAFRESTVKESISRFKRTEGSKGAGIRFDTLRTGGVHRRGGTDGPRNSDEMLVSLFGFRRIKSRKPTFSKESRSLDHLALNAHAFSLWGAKP